MAITDIAIGAATSISMLRIIAIHPLIHGVILIINTVLLQNPFGSPVSSFISGAKKKPGHSDPAGNTVVLPVFIRP